MFRLIIESLWSARSVGAFQEFFGPGWGQFFETVTLLGAHEAIAVVVALALWLSGRRLAYTVLGIVVFAMTVDLLLWQIIGLERPSGPDVIVRATSPVSSFPSGHTVIATCVWGILSLHRRIPKVAVAIIVLAVMLSRLYLGMHYVGDVLGGAVIGLVLLYIYPHIWNPLARWFVQRSFWFFLVLGLAAPLLVLPFTFILDSPRAWVAFGAALGGGLGMPLEYRYVRYAPESDDWHRVAVKTVIGLGVLVALVFGPRLIGWSSTLIDATVFTLATLWMVLGAPALFAWFGLGRHANAARQSPS